MIKTNKKTTHYVIIDKDMIKSTNKKTTHYVIIDKDMIF